MKKNPTLSCLRAPLHIRLALLQLFLKAFHLGHPASLDPLGLIQGFHHGLFITNDG